jgi:SagB-type dehydrogenase family enzyme
MQRPYELFESTLMGMSGAQAPPASLGAELSVAAQTAGPFLRPLGSVSIAAARRRRSERAYGRLEVGALAELLSLTLLDAAQPGSRPYPAAGALYAVHPYLAVLDVDGLDAGVYYVRWATGTLERLDDGEAARTFVDEALVQEDKASIPAVALLMADTRMARTKYHDRAARFAMIEAGCLLQTLYLAAAELGLGVCGLGAIADRAALRLCQLPPSPQVFLTCGAALGGAPPQG